MPIYLQILRQKGYQLVINKNRTIHKIKLQQIDPDMNSCWMYLDFSYIFHQHFQQISQIPNKDTQFIFQQIPMISQSFEAPPPHQRRPPLIGRQKKSKRQNRMAFDLRRQLLAAHQGTEFVRGWSEDFLRFTNSLYEKTLIRMTQCGVVNHQWATPQNRYLTVMHFLNNVIGSKQIQIDGNRQGYGSVEGRDQIIWFVDSWAFRNGDFTTTTQTTVILKARTIL